jgi:hypothetical protein
MTRHVIDPSRGPARVTSRPCRAGQAPRGTSVCPVISTLFSLCLTMDHAAGKYIQRSYMASLIPMRQLHAPSGQQHGRALLRVRSSPRLAAFSVSCHEAVPSRAPQLILPLSTPRLQDRGSYRSLLSQVWLPTGGTSATIDEGRSLN